MQGLVTKEVKDAEETQKNREDSPAVLGWRIILCEFSSMVDSRCSALGSTLLAAR